MMMTETARQKMREAIIWLMLISLGFALGFIYGRHASVTPIIIEKCDSI